MSRENSLSILEHLQYEMHKEEENYVEALHQKKIFAELKLIKNRIKRIKEVISKIQKEQNSYLKQ